MECYRCEEATYECLSSMREHWVGGRRVRPCRVKNFYHPSGVTERWRAFVNGKITGGNSKWWREQFGEGPGSVYAFVSKHNSRVIGWVGKNESGNVRQRIVNHGGALHDDEDPYLVASGLSIEGTRTLEKALLQHHDFYNPRRQIRNTRYSWAPTPEGWTQGTLRDRALETLAQLSDDIDAGRVSPINYTSGLRKRKSTVDESAVDEPLPRQSPSTEEIASKFAGRTPQQLDYLSKRAQMEMRKKSGSTDPNSTKRRRDDGGGSRTG